MRVLSIPLRLRSSVPYVFMYVREPVDLTRSEMLMLSSPATVFATSTPCIMMWFLTVLQQHSMMNECWTMNMGAGLTNNVVWCGAVWCGDSGAVSCGVWWCVVVCGVVHGVARCGIAWRGVVSRSERCSTVVSGAVVSVVAWWCGVVWCGVAVVCHDVVRHGARSQRRACFLKRLRIAEPSFCVRK